MGRASQALRVAAGLAAAVLLCAGGTTAPPARGDGGAGPGSTTGGPLSEISHHWASFGRSAELACLGGSIQGRAVALMDAAMGRATRAALREHADPEAAIHAAARTSLIRTARRSRTNPPCREHVTSLVQGEYAAATALLPDRPTVWRGAALGDATG